MENVLRAVEMDITLSEEFVLPVINHARLVPTTQLNVLHVLLTLSAQTEDVSDHALKELILIQFQALADHVMLHALHAVQKSIV